MLYMAKVKPAHLGYNLSEPYTAYVFLMMGEIIARNM